MNAFAHLPADEPLRETLDPGIWVEARDKDSRSEDDRQIAFVRRIKRDCRGIAIHAVPNGGRQSDWARIRAEKMGVVAGEPDLGLDWKGGAARIEFKDGREMPRQNQVERLNQLHRLGKNVAVCRTPEGALGWLASIGAPV